MFKIKTTPSIVIENKTYTGFKSISDIEELIPNLVKDRKQKEKMKINYRIHHILRLQRPLSINL